MLQLTKKCNRLKTETRFSEKEIAVTRVKRQAKSVIALGIGYFYLQYGMLIENIKHGSRTIVLKFSPGLSVFPIWFPLDFYLALCG